MAKVMHPTKSSGEVTAKIFSSSLDVKPHLGEKTTLHTWGKGKKL